MMVFYTLVCIYFAIQAVYCQGDPTVGLMNTCGGYYNKTEKGAVIKTPNFGGGNIYPNNLQCGWIIESPEEAADISISFHSFELESTKRCSKYDYVMLYKKDNGQTNWKPLGYLEGYCGQQTAFVVTAQTKRVLLKFVSDSSRGARGFNASFSIRISQAAPRILSISKLDDKSYNSTIFAEERAVITIQCRVSAIPPAEFQWRKVFNGTSIVLRAALVKNYFPNGSIQLHNLEMSDTGEYECWASNKINSVKGSFQLRVAQKCVCPKVINVAWYNYPPYTKHTVNDDKTGNPIYKGIFYVILIEMIKSVCGNCSKGHGRSKIHWADEVNRKKGLSDVKNSIEDGGGFDIYFPIAGGKLDDKYRNVYYFLPTVPSPGIAFLVIKDEAGTSAMAILTSILQGWPILVLTVVMAALAGIIMWVLDTYWNEEQLPRRFSEGIVEGFWWAFVTMTTVGYGDIAPVGVPGRLFAIIWILTGLVIISIFTGVITTSLTVVAMTTNVKLYGTTVGAINNTAEYRMGVIKNAKMKNFSTFDDLKAEMDARRVEGCLVDSYVAAYEKEKFKNFRVNNIFPLNNAYGLVLGKRMSKQYIYEKCTAYIEANKAQITKDIEENTGTLTKPKESAALEKTAGLFDPRNKLFLNSVTGTTIILFILIFFGLLFEYAYLRPRHRMINAAKNLEMVESIEVKQMAQRAKLLKETLLYEVREFYDRWSVRLKNLTLKHSEEKKKLLHKGKSTGPALVEKKSPIPAEEAVELDDTDGLDGQKLPSTPDSSNSGSQGSFHDKSTFSLKNSTGKEETSNL